MITADNAAFWVQLLNIYILLNFKNMKLFIGIYYNFIGEFTRHFHFLSKFEKLVTEKISERINFKWFDFI